MNQTKDKARAILLPLGFIALGFLIFLEARGFFQTTGIRWAFILSFSFLLSFLLTPLIRSLAWRYSILDQPAMRKVHQTSTPLLGGLSIYLSFIVSLLVNNIYDSSVLVILAAGSLVMLISLVDDIRSLSAKLKLLVQFAAATMVIVAGVRINIFPRHGMSEFVGILSMTGNILLTYLWILGITNAMNFLDGIDGLATGLGAIISLFLGIVAFNTQQPFLGWFALAMLGSCLGFLPYNFRRTDPATIFLGDTGSIFIGFMLACLGITGNWSQMNPLVSITAPIMIFGVLIFDMTHTTVSRIATGKVRSFHDWVAYVGRDHIHHRMQRLFQDKKKSVLLILCISACLGLSAVIMPQLDTFSSTLIMAQGIICFLMFTAVNFYHEKSLSTVRDKRSMLRIQILFDVRIEFLENKRQLDGVVLDISDAGTKILLLPGFSIKEGDRVHFAEKLDAETDLSWMDGTVQWKREVMVDGNTDGYWECGVHFDKVDTRNILEIAEYLHNRQIKEQVVSKKLVQQRP